MDIMKLLLIALLVSVTSGNVAHASAKVYYTPRSHSVNLTAHIYFYGEAATENLIKSATNEINQYWNGGSHLDSNYLLLLTHLGGATENFNMQVTSEIVTAEQAALMQSHSPNPDSNFIELRNGNTAAGDRSYMDQICGNTGIWFASDDLGKSTTAAHEFGHGLCLEHPDSDDLRGTEQPPVMAPRVTLVDAIYQWDLNAQAGAAGGTMSPYQRRVIQNDIDRMPLATLKFDSNGFAFLKADHAAKEEDRVY